MNGIELNRDGQYFDKDVYPDLPEDADLEKWAKEYGYELAKSELEDDATQEVSEAYYDNGDSDACRLFEPKWPNGEGWKVFAAFHHDEGYVVQFYRNLPPPMSYDEWLRCYNFDARIRKKSDYHSWCLGFAFSFDKKRREANDGNH